MITHATVMKHASTSAFLQCRDGATRHLFCRPRLRFTTNGMMQAAMIVITSALCYADSIVPGLVEHPG